MSRAHCAISHSSVTGHNKECSPRRAPSSIALALALLTGCSGDEGQSTNPLVPTSVSDQEQTAVIPSNLTLPLLLNEINLRGDINPFGVVRSSKDLAELGHSGIDVPLNTGASIYAVADGQIISVEPSADARPGSLVKLLLVADQTAGTGWVFLYEHISLLTGLGTNSLGEQRAAHCDESDEPCVREPPRAGVHIQQLPVSFESIVLGRST